MRDLLEDYVPRVYRFALRLTQDPDAAADLTQETFLRAWRRRQELHEPGRAQVWLFRIAVNLWRDQLRRARSPVARAGSLPEDAPLRMPPVDDRVADQELLDLALQAMEELPGQQREAMYLRACEGLSAAEIAAILGTTAASVKTSVSAARRKLRERLGKLFESFFFVL